MTQHTALSVHTDIFVPFGNSLLHIALIMPALHHLQQVKQIALERVSQGSIGFDLCHADTILHENRKCRRQQPFSIATFHLAHRLP